MASDLKDFPLNKEKDSLLEKKNSLLKDRG